MLIQKMRRIIVSNGTNIRRNSIAFSALIGSIGGSVLEIVSEKFINELVNKGYFKDSMLLRIITLIVLSVVTFLLCYLIINIFIWIVAESRFIRVHIFKEKIIEGYWFETIYYDVDYKHKFCVGIVQTYYDDNGELVYRGTDYSFKNFSETGEFISKGTILKYDKNSSIAKLLYIYDFRNKDQLQSGYGQIDFNISQNHSESHRGYFVNSDGRTYHFIADLVKSKKDVKALGKGGSVATQVIKKLSNNFQKSHDYLNDESVERGIKIHTDIYNTDPNSFDEFSRCEDCDNNLLSYFNSIEINDSTNVLDIGAGTGRFTFFVVDRAKRVVCTDASEMMISFLKNSIHKNDKKIKNLKNKCTCVCCDHLLLQVELKDEKFDIIIAGFTLSCLFVSTRFNYSQKEKMFFLFFYGLKELLNDNGRIIIIESSGVGNSPDECELLECDKGLCDYYDILDKSGFDSTEISTDFRFNNKAEAFRVLTHFWGKEGSDKIKYEPNTREYVLYEKTIIWSWQKNQ